MTTLIRDFFVGDNNAQILFIYHKSLDGRRPSHILDEQFILNARLILLEHKLE